MIKHLWNFIKYIVLNLFLKIFCGNLQNWKTNLHLTPKERGSDSGFTGESDSLGHSQGTDSEASLSPFIQGHLFSSLLVAPLTCHHACVLSSSEPMDCGLPGSSVHGIVQAGVGCHALLQGIFLTQGLKLHFLCLLHLQAWEAQFAIHHLL